MLSLNPSFFMRSMNCLYDLLDRLVIEEPRIYGMILYVEQPFPYDLEANRIDVHSVSALSTLATAATLWPASSFMTRTPVASRPCELISRTAWRVVTPPSEMSRISSSSSQVKAATKEAEKNGILGHGLHHPFHTMFEDVFEELPWHLEEQATQAIRERRIKWPDWKEDEA